MDTVQYALDAARSRFLVQASSAGLLSGFGHNPVIAIRSFTGVARFRRDAPEQSSLELRIDASSLAVTGDVSDRDRRDMERIMRDDVLQTQNYPEIVFSTHGVEANKVAPGTYRMNIAGRLDLHGVSGTVAVSGDVVFGEDGIQAKGQFSLLQTDFGIRPVSFAAGTLKLKDELQFAFDIFGVRQR